MEEYVDKEKVKIFIKWLQANNPLYEDIDSDLEKLTELEEEITDGIEEYSKQPSTSLDDEIGKELFSDESDNEFEDLATKEQYSPIEIEDEINVQHYDSVMCNKYEQEVEENSVAKRYADIITQYETIKVLPKLFQDDFEMEDYPNINQCDDELFGDSSSNGIREGKNIFQNQCGDELLEEQVETSPLVNQNFKREIKIGSMKSDEVKEKAGRRIGNINAKMEKNSNCSWRVWGISKLGKGYFS